jgi:hypothetical protein
MRSHQHVVDIIQPGAFALLNPRREYVVHVELNPVVRTPGPGDEVVYPTGKTHEAEWARVNILTVIAAFGFLPSYVRSDAGEREMIVHTSASLAEPGGGVKPAEAILLHGRPSFVPFKALRR